MGFWDTSAGKAGLKGWKMDREPMAEAMKQKPETPETVSGSGASSVLSGVIPGDGLSDGNGKSESFPVSIPSIGAYRTEDHRYYWNGKGPVPSVTTILKVLDKPAVYQWAKRTVAEIAIRRAEEVLARSLESQDDAIKWLAGMPEYEADTAGKLGTGIHLLADMVARGAESDSEGFQIPDDHRPYLEAFRGFLAFLQPRGAIISSEKMVWSHQGYAGTYDLLVRLDGELWLVDIKTSKGYYPEYALQLAAYGFSDLIIIEQNPEGYPMPQIQRYGVLHLRPDQYQGTDTEGWRLVEYPVQEKDYVAFLGALEIWNWKSEGRFTRQILNSGILKH